ncbi:hypothetical protein KP509_32G033300 [Ceratopteris richardii]|uniref:Uncharacterized protein n=1 Tax=Ceratopteris richardii TaxID=49495 RepID=A0A8T2QUG1_CERRI|nr:hypothetical protein KP509_32G033300 [Ceratopteris richardii]
MLPKTYESEVVKRGYCFIAFHLSITTSMTSRLLDKTEEKVNLQSDRKSPEQRTAPTTTRKPPTEAPGEDDLGEDGVPVEGGVIELQFVADTMPSLHASSNAV